MNASDAMRETMDTISLSLKNKIYDTVKKAAQESNVVCVVYFDKELTSLEFKVLQEVLGYEVLLLESCGKNKKSCYRLSWENAKPSLSRRF